MPKFSPVAAAWAVFYALLWAGSVWVLSNAGGENAEEALSLAPIFAVLGPLLAWGLTAIGRRDDAPVAVARPSLEAWAVIGYLVLYAALFLGWGLTAVREWFPNEPQKELAIDALKITAHLILPAGMLIALGGKIGPLMRAHAGRLAFWLPLIVLGGLLLALLSVISPSLKQIAELNLTSSDWLWAGPGTFLWLVLAVGLCEEFLFRAVLLSRLTAWLKSGTGAVVIGAVLFGLAHAPGLWLRADPGEFGHFHNPLFVLAYCVAVLSPTGIFFGILWQRTKSLWLLVLLHVCVDFLPNVPDFVHSFGSFFGHG